MRLTVLGSGVMLPTRARSPAGYLVESGTTRILLDCGHGTIARLVQRDVDLYSINAVCVTHFHTDHFTDVLPLVHGRWVEDVNNKRPHTPLALVGPQTLAERLQKLRAVYWPEPNEAYPISIHEDVPVTVGTLAVQPFPVEHVPWFPCVGFKIREGERSLVYTGDVHRIAGAVVDRVLTGASLLLVEAGAVRAQGTHLTPQGALEIAHRAGIPRVVLTHIRAARVPDVRAAVAHAPHVQIADDGMVVDL